MYVGTPFVQVGRKRRVWSISPSHVGPDQPDPRPNSNPNPNPNPNISARGRQGSPAIQVDYYTAN